LGGDILQCEKMDYETLKNCVMLKKEFSNLLVSATGGINKDNIAEFAKCGVDFIVTSSPYHAKPLDIKVKIKEDN
jgi:molybdenum transport protein